MKKFLTAFCALILSSNVFAASLPVDIKPKDLRVFGDKENQNAIYVFSSLTCPHCSTFHKNVMPELLSEYVDKNKAKLVYVDMPGDPMSMTGSMIARCIPSENYEKFMTVMFENQSVWGRSRNAREIMTGYAKLLGMSNENVNECLADLELRKTILGQRTNLANLYSIEAMPTVVVVSNDAQKTFVGTNLQEITDGINKTLGQ